MTDDNQNSMKEAEMLAKEALSLLCTKVDNTNMLLNTVAAMSGIALGGSIPKDEHKEAFFDCFFTQVKEITEFTMNYTKKERESNTH